MSREARKTAQIWASIEKMQKKEDDLSLSDNSADKTLKQRKKKKHKRSPSVDDATLTTGPDTTGASDAGNHESNTLTQANLLTLHKSSSFIRNSPFVPPKKKWVSQWETHHHHLGPKVSNKDEGEVAHRIHATKSEVLVSGNSPTSTNDSTPTVSVSHPPPSDAVPVEKTRPTSNTSASHPESPHHAAQLIQLPHLDHHVTPVPALPSAPRASVPAANPLATLPLVVAKEEDPEEGEYTASPARATPPVSSAPVTDFALDAMPQDHTPPPHAPASSREFAPPQNDAPVIAGPSPGNENAENTSPSTSATPAAPPSPVMNALGSRRKRKSLWDVGDPRADDVGVRSNPSSRRPPDGPGHSGRSASADGRRRSWSRSQHTTPNSSNFSTSHHPNHSSAAYPPARRHPPPPQQPLTSSVVKPRDPPRSMSSSWLPSR